MKTSILAVLLVLMSSARAEEVYNDLNFSESNGWVAYQWFASLDISDPNYDKITTRHWGRKDSTDQHAPHNNTYTMPGAPQIKWHDSGTFNLQAGTHDYCSTLDPLQSYFSGPNLSDLDIVVPAGCETICYFPCPSC
jgi:hypothetical protein